ncbi:MAG: hydrolase [Candidatus Bathyarchaeia archaeon]
MTNSMGSGSTRIHTLLAPDNCVFLLIDYQPQMAFAVTNIDGQTLINNAVGLAKAAKVFGIPSIVTTVATKTFSGPMFSQLQDVFPGVIPIDRTTMNSWEDDRVVAAVKKTGRRKIVMGGLWTEVCIADATIDALQEGFEVYVVADACGATSTMAQEMAMQRMIQAGAVPVTWLQVLLELQRDWARTKTYDAVLNVAKEHGGPYGVGIQYAKAMLGEHAGG